MRIATLVLALAASCSSKPQNGPPPDPAVVVAGRTYPLKVVATRDGRKALADLDFSSDAVLVLHGHARYQHYEIPRRFDLLVLDDAGKILETWTQAEPVEGGVTTAAESARALFLPPGSGAKAGDRVSLPPIKVAGEPEAALRIGARTVRVETARTWEERSHGLMFRPRMSKDDGMLFVYDRPDMKSFWMGNTLIDLDIAFFREDRTLINVVEMKKYPDPSTDPGDRARSEEPAVYVLELNLGWFRSHGLTDASGRPVGKVLFEPVP
ncbi:MAG: DUF192 domain-containing protein [Planctomycetes bacterium]|nr:DUF192 domain-containing protein [Planctomycetota bacterium]